MALILDEDGRIVAANTTMLETMGVKDPKEALGLRHGDAIACLAAQDHPDGCGASDTCAGCGAAKAIARVNGA